jgi:thiamine monophosphate kinase
MSQFEWIEDELVMADHVFERADYSRAAYRYMCSQIEEHHLPELTPEQNWQKAAEAWDNLTPEMQAQLIILSDKEVRNGRDIREGLLATLHGYQGFVHIKKLFEHAIRLVQFE